MPSVGDTQYVVVSPTRVLDRGLYDDVIVSLCRPSTYCHIRFWSDPQMVPSGTELTNAHRAASSARYIFNPRTGQRQLLWNCRLVNKPGECF